VSVGHGALERGRKRMEQTILPASTLAIALHNK
jgi:hypothetical protein